MRIITVEELANNLDYYLTLSNIEDIYVIKNKKIISVLVNPDYRNQRDVIEFAESLPEIDPNFDYDKTIKEEILKRCGL